LAVKRVESLYWVIDLGADELTLIVFLIKTAEGYLAEVMVNGSIDGVI